MNEDIQIIKKDSLNKKELRLFKKMVIELNLQPFVKRIKVPYEELRSLDIGERVVYGLTFKGVTIGFFEIVLYENYVLLDYFYIQKSFRKLGFGAIFLERLKAIYPNIVLYIFKYLKNYQYLVYFYEHNGFKKIDKPMELNSSISYLEQYFKFNRLKGVSN